MFESTHSALRWAGRLAAAALCGVAMTLAAAPAVQTAASPAKAAATTKSAKATRTATPSPEAIALRERIENAPQGIAGLHRTKSGALKCEKCHGDTVAPDDNQTVENRECIACHEGYEELAKASAKKLANPALNAHASHLGPEIACTACHQGHQESKAYCVNCHTNFQMAMPGNVPAARR